MAVAQSLGRGLVDCPTELALELGGKQAAAHPDLAVDPPDRKLEAFLLKREMPGAHMIVDAVDEGSVEVEEECEAVPAIKARIYTEV